MSLITALILTLSVLLPGELGNPIPEGPARWESMEQFIQYHTIRRIHGDRVVMFHHNGYSIFIKGKEVRFYGKAKNPNRKADKDPRSKKTKKA